MYAIGELIWHMMTCRPDLSQAVMKCASASAAPMETHNTAVKSIFCYLAATTKEFKNGLKEMWSF
jgi:hypothetical protein